MASMEALPVGYIAALRIRGQVRPNMPDNWLECKGQWLKRDKYPELFAMVGDRWGGNGKTTFKLPKLHAVDEASGTTRIGYIKSQPEPEAESL